MSNYLAAKQISDFLLHTKPLNNREKYPCDCLIYNISIDPLDPRRIKSSLSTII